MKEDGKGRGMEGDEREGRKEGKGERGLRRIGRGGGGMGREGEESVCSMSVTPSCTSLHWQEVGEREGEKEVV